MYKIYINGIALSIAESMPDSPESYQLIDSQNFDFLTFYNTVKSRKERLDYLLLTADAKRLFKNVKKYLKLIRAAGGLVRSEENRYLFIFRKGKWDLPKGKLDDGEKNRDAAVREVEEECGITVSGLGKKICKTWHVYEMGGKVILKKTTWYHMNANDQPDLTPQLEEEITEARWISPGDFNIVKENTYPLVSDLISIAEG